MFSDFQILSLIHISIVPALLSTPALSIIARIIAFFCDDFATIRITSFSEKSETPRNCSAPVSYTHLDVYKRQDENIKKTTELVNVAHNLGLSIEAEVGSIGGEERCV